MARYFLPSTKINHYLQNDTKWKNLSLGSSTIGAIGCAFCCASMCVKQRPDVVHAAGFTSESTDFGGIAKKYSMTYDADNAASFTGIIALLKKGRPAIVKQKSNSHWVVVYGFDGNESNPAASEFSCFCPEYGAKTLDNSYGYSGIYSVRTIY